MIYFILCLLFIVGCASGPKNYKELGEEYESIKGLIAAPPVLENSDERLILYLKDENEDVMVAIATNHENDNLLQNLAKRLVSVNETVFLFGQPVNGRYEEYLEGVDFEILALSYLDENSDSYMTVITTYGDRVGDLIRSMGWTQFLKNVGKKAVEAAL